MNEVHSSRTERRRTRTREAILDAAEVAFIDGGYRGARIGDIADAADVAVGSVYSYFGNKDGVYLALVERAADLFARYMAEAYHDGWSPLEQVMAAGDTYVRFYLEHPGAFRFLAFDGVETQLPIVDQALLGRVAKRVGALIDEFQGKIQAASTPSSRHGSSGGRGTGRSPSDCEPTSWPSAPSRSKPASTMRAGSSWTALVRLRGATRAVGPEPVWSGCRHPSKRSWAALMARVWPNTSKKVASRARRWPWSATSIERPPPSTTKAAAARTASRDAAARAETTSAPFA